MFVGLGLLYTKINQGQEFLLLYLIEINKHSIYNMQI